MTARKPATWPSAKRRLLGASLAAVACFASLDGARAAVLATQTVNFGSDGGLRLSDYDGTGTLREVDFSASASAFAIGFVTNFGTSPGSASFEVIKGLFLESGTDDPAPLMKLGQSANGTIFNLFSDMGASFGTETYINLQPNMTELYGGFSVSGSSTAVFTQPADVSAFVGTGSYSFVPFDFNFIVTTYLSHNPKISGSVDVSDFGSLTVTYIGDPAVVPIPPPPPSSAVPEPATWAMMLVGFGGLGGALRLTRSGSTSRRLAAAPRR